MKYAIVTSAAPAKFRHKPDCKQNSSHALQQQSAFYDQLCQPDNTGQLQRIDTLLQQLPLPQADLSPDIDRKEHTNGHKAQTACLNQQQDHHLPEQTPVPIRIHHHQSCHAGGTGGRKQSIQKPGCFSSCRTGQHQKQCSCNNNQKKSYGNQLNL